MKISKLALKDFISKYNLSKNFESVKWAFKDGNLYTKITSTTKTLLGEVKIRNFYDKEEYNYGEKGAIIGVFNTEKFTKCLNTLNEEIHLNLGDKVGERFNKLQLKDSKYDYQLNLGDLNFIPKTISLNKANYSVKNVKLDKSFNDTFLTACNALEYRKFILKVIEKGVNKVYFLSINIVESEGSSNKVSFELPILFENNDGENSIKELGEMHFTGNFFQLILANNKNCTSGTLNIDEDGMVNINFISIVDGLEIISQYYLIKDENN